MKTVSEALLDAIEKSGLTLYRIAKDSGVTHGTLHPFVVHQSGLRLENVDKLAVYFGLELQPAKKSKRKSSRN